MNYMNKFMKIKNTLSIDVWICCVLTFVTISTRWFFIQGNNSVPFDIQDEIALVWALKDFLIGEWSGISGPIHRFVASYLFAPFYGVYFFYLWLINSTSGLGPIQQSFFIQSSNAYNDIGVWVLVPRLVSWLSLVLSIPLQYMLTRRITDNRITSVLAAILLLFSFTHIYSSFFGLPDGIGLLLFQGTLLYSFSYINKRYRKSLIVFSILIAFTLLVQVLNGIVFILAGIWFLVSIHRTQNNIISRKLVSEIVIIAFTVVICLIIINPLFYLAPSNILDEVNYGIGEWIPSSESNILMTIIYILRVIFDEILGLELSLLLLAAILRFVMLKGNVDWIYMVIGPLLLAFFIMAFFTELTYETNLLSIYVPVTILSAWVLTQIKLYNFPDLHLVGNVFSRFVWPLILIVVLWGPVNKWFSFYQLTLEQGTRLMAKNWIEANIPSDSKIYMAPYTYSAPLIKSVSQIKMDSIDGELSDWRLNSEIGNQLSPSYFLVNDSHLDSHQYSEPDYFIQSIFVYGEYDCKIDREIDIIDCPYNPLRGSYPYFSAINQIPNNLDRDLLLLREFTPLCSGSGVEKGIINYRTNVLRNNIDDLCTFGPIINIYEVVSSFQSQ